MDNYIRGFLVISPKTVVCGKCYTIDNKGNIDWNAIDRELLIEGFDVPTGNCHLTFKRGVDSEIVSRVAKCWEDTYTVVYLLLKYMKNVRVEMYMANENSRTYNKKWVVVRTEKSTYWLNFDRLYTEETSNGLIINAIYGAIQFYRDIDTSHKAEGPNSRIRTIKRPRDITWDLFYPDYYDPDELSIIDWVKEKSEEIDYERYGFTRSNGIIHKVKAYNPDLTIVNKPEEIAITFVEFIKTCEQNV